MTDPSRELSDHPTAVARRELRRLMRCPPLRTDDAEKVLAALATGQGITEIGDTPGLPAYWLINLWRREHPEFDELCVAASEAGADALAWECLEIADADGRAPATGLRVSTVLAWVGVALAASWALSALGVV